MRRAARLLGHSSVSAYSRVKASSLTVILTRTLRRIGPTMRLNLPLPHSAFRRIAATAKGDRERLLNAQSRLSGFSPCGSP